MSLAPFIVLGNDVVNLIVSRCMESESGVRMIGAIPINSMLPDVSREFLNRMMAGKAITGVTVRAQVWDFQYQFG